MWSFTIKEGLRRDDIGKELRGWCLQNIDRDTNSHIASMTGTLKVNSAIHEEGTKPILESICI